ncbi:MAG: SLC13/DASS family transporter, partial [Asticcacaulis sp.]
MDLSPFVSPALISALILAGALVLFVTERVRHDLIAVLALLAGLITGVVKPEDALSGFGDPAVVAVAAVLIVGRTLELSGVAAKLARYIMFGKATYSLQMAMLMAVGALLSAFMNNIAALVIVMPLGAEIARQNKKAVGTILMPLAFATIMGGMITLIGTPANMILSSVREERLGQGFGFFAMAPVGIAVAVVGILYLAVIGWRLLPPRRGT